MSIWHVGKHRGYFVVPFIRCSTYACIICEGYHLTYLMFSERRRDLTLSAEIRAAQKGREAAKKDERETGKEDLIHTCVYMLYQFYL